MPHVILVNEFDELIGTMEKMEAHQKGLLHRAFSIFIFNEKQEMLLQQRASTKYHSANLWTNACCSHPLPGEDITIAAHRRLGEEMGFDTSLKRAFHFTYKTTFETGLTEHEFDHVFTGNYDGIIRPDSSEVKDFQFMPMDEIQNNINLYPEQYTSWFLLAFPKLEIYLSG